MTGSRLRWATCSLMLLAILSLPALAAKKPILEMIPKEVSGFVVLDDLSRADKAVEALAMKTQFPIPGPTMILKMATGLGDAIDEKGSIAALYIGRKPPEKGMDIDLDQDPSTVFLCSTTDFEKFLAAFEEPEKVEKGLYRVTLNDVSMLLTSKDGYAVLAPDEDREALDLVLKGKTSIAAEVQPWKTWMDEQIAYGFITQNELKSYRAQLVAEFDRAGMNPRHFREDMDGEGAEDWGEAIPEEEEELIVPPGLPVPLNITDTVEDVDKTIEGRTVREERVDKKIDTKAIKLEREKRKQKQKAAQEHILEIYDGITLLAAGAKIDNMGVTRVTFRCGMKPGSWLSKTLENVKPIDGNLFASLPPGTFNVAYGGPTLKGIQELLETMQNSATTTTPESIHDSFWGQGPEWKLFHASLQGLTQLVSTPQKNQDLLQKSYTVSWMADSNKMFDHIKKDCKDVQQQINEALKQSSAPMLQVMGQRDPDDEKDQEDKDKKPKKEPLYCKVTTKETTVDGCKTQVVTYDLTKGIQKMQESMGGFSMIIMPFLECIYGKEPKIVEYNIQLDAHRVLTTFCPDPKERKQLVQIAKAQKGGLADEPDVKKVLAMLPPDATWQALWSPSGTVESINWFLKKIAMSAQMLMGQSPEQKLPAFKKTPPIGVAVVPSKTLVEATVVIPPDTMAESVQFGIKLRELLEPMFAPPSFQEDFDRPMPVMPIR